MQIQQIIETMQHLFHVYYREVLPSDGSAITREQMWERLLQKAPIEITLYFAAHNESHEADVRRMCFPNTEWAIT